MSRRFRSGSLALVLFALIVVGPASAAQAQTATPPTATPTASPTARPTTRPTTRPTARPTARATPRSTPTPSPTPSPTPDPTLEPTARIVRVEVAKGGGWIWFLVGLVAGGLAGRASWTWQRRLRHR